MKIAKDSQGYFILDNANQKVILNYKGQEVCRLPTIFHLGLTYWVRNEHKNIITTPFKVIIDNISHFKSIRFYILQYAIDHYSDEVIQTLLNKYEELE